MHTVLLTPPGLLSSSFMFATTKRNNGTDLYSSETETLRILARVILSDSFLPSTTVVTIRRNIRPADNTIFIDIYLSEAPTAFVT